MTQRKPGFYLALFTTLFTAAVVILGAYTRLKDAGLGCPDWPGCYGFATVPTQIEHIEIANQRFPETPVEQHKGWPEMIHRYFASALGLLIIGIVVQALRHAKQPNQPIKLPLFLLGLVILQGLFGMWTVTLKLWPQVVTAHLLGGFTTLSLLWLLTLRLSGKSWLLSSQQKQKLSNLRVWAAIGLGVVITQILLGGWTTSNYAAVACPDLPTCQGQWWPHMDIFNGFNFLQSIGPNYLGGTLDNAARVAIHMGHRIGALVTALYLLGFFFKAFSFSQATPLRKTLILLVGVLILQICLGISNVIFSVPLLIAVAHNAVGALLLLIMITLNYYLFNLKQP